MSTPTLVALDQASASEPVTASYAEPAEQGKGEAVQHCWGVLVPLRIGGELVQAATNLVQPPRRPADVTSMQILL